MKKVRKDHKKIFLKEERLKDSSIYNRGTKAMNKHKGFPYVGHPNPNKNPERILQKKNCIFLLFVKETELTIQFKN